MVTILILKSTHLAHLAVWPICTFNLLLQPGALVADAQFNLGVLYARGEGVQKNEAKAVNWYRKAAEQGDADAQLLLGGMYEQGNGVQKNEAKALIWYRKAAEQGDADARSALQRLGLQ